MLIAHASRCLLLYCIVLVSALFATSHASAQERDPVTSTCTADKSADVKSATAALDASPGELEARFHLADALLTAGCNDAAVHVLEDGEEFHPRNIELQGRLRAARSVKTEQTYFEGLELAEIAAKAQRNRLRCVRLGDIAACDEVLRQQPADQEALLARGDALFKADRLADALNTYRQALERGADPALVQPKIAVSTERRQSLVARCQTGTDATTIQACRSALLRGADDEFAIHKRLGSLLQAANQPAEALDEFIAANRLKQDDNSVALAIIALTDSTRRKDAAALTARGTAQLALGNATEALASLRQAQTLAPGVAEIRSRLAAAERVSKTQSVRSATVARPDAPVKAQSGPVTQPVRNLPADGNRAYSNLEPASRTH